ncbi:MAG: RAMP superfamily CRISPR-associated protein [Acidobacteriota bacterium]
MTRTAPRLLRDVARVTIELTSPLSIGSGFAEDLLDAPVVTDCNRLPTLPGTSLAGVLRQGYREHLEATGTPVAQLDATVARVFGIARSKLEGGASEDRASLVMVSHGHLHDATNRPVPARAAADRLDDAVLQGARLPLTRQQVRLTHRGVADVDVHGLYDREVVAAGHRFTFELAVWWNEGDEHGGEGVLDTLLGILLSPATRLGAKGTNGLGRFKVAEAGYRRRRFDLRDADQLGDYSRLPVDLAEPVPEEVLPVVTELPAALEVAGTVTARLTLKPRGSWMIGGGTPTHEDTEHFARDDDEDGEVRVPDRVPYREPAVTWRGTAEKAEGQLAMDVLRPVIPGSGLKGALRHRTTFHVNVLEGNFADELDRQEELEKAGAATVQELFGHASDNPDEGERQGRMGRVLVEECRLETVPAACAQQHVSLDRFTAGPMDGRLFDEVAYWKGETIHLEVRVCDAANVGPVPRSALARAVRDLATGRLSLGAGHGRGHGFFEGKVTWSDETWENAADERPAEVAHG